MQYASEFLMQLMLLFVEIKDWKIKWQI